MGSWEPVLNALTPWVTRAAMLLFFVGAIDFGWTFHDTHSMSKGGLSKMIASGVLLAVWNQLSSIFNI